MALKDTLEQYLDHHSGRARTCRICHLIDTLPPDEGQALDAATQPSRNVGPKPIADALAKEGFGDLYQSVRHHIYVCQASR